MSVLTDARNLELLARYEKAWSKLVDRVYIPQAVRVILEIEAEPFEVALLEEAAPRTCQAFLKLLPYEGTCIHAAWSGDAIRQLEDFVLGEVPEPENGTDYTAPGDVCYTHGHKEFAVMYGDTYCRMPYGRVRECVFGVIADRMREFQKVGRIIRLTGAKAFRVTLKR